MMNVSTEQQKQLAHRLLSKLDNQALHRLCDGLVDRNLVQITHARVVSAASAPVPLRPEPPGLGWEPYPYESDYAVRPQAYDYDLMVAEVMAAQLVQDFHMFPGPYLASPPIPQSTPHGKPPVRISLSERVAPSQRSQRRRGHATEAGGQPAEATNKSVDEGKNSDEFDPTITSLILRNLNPSLTQEGMQDWLEAKGYKDMFDFVLWFPAKRTSRLTVFPYAFVNFITPELAHAFRTSYHNSVSVEKKDLAEKDVFLNITSAKVQGFVDNFVRFGHLMTDGAKTQCRPYFSPSSLEKHIAPEHHRLVEEQAARHAEALEPLPGGEITTVIMRNLPLLLQDQAGAMEWFDRQGCGEYDYLVFFPGKMASKEHKSRSGTNSDRMQGLGYMFVNFTKAEAAQDCIDKLHDTIPDGGTEALSVVAARKQGKKELQSHFADVFSLSSGRVTPWANAGREVCREQVAPAPGLNSALDW